MTRPENLLEAAEGGDGRLIQLDGLRAFAAISIILQHSTNVESSTRFPLGIAGVWLSFALSGFLITGTLIGVKDRAAGDKAATGFAWRAFHARRVLRTFPVYHGTLIAVYVLDLPEVRAHVGAYIVHIADVAVALPGRAVPSLFHLWTISVVVKFSVVWPAIVLLAPRRWIIAASALMVLLAPISRSLMLTTPGHRESAHSLPPSSVDGLGMATGSRTGNGHDSAGSPWGPGS